MFDYEKLKSLSSAKRYPKNTIVIHEGDSMPYSLYIVLSGSVRVVKFYGKYDQSVLANLTPGDFFGEMSLFMKKPRTATVITIEDSVILEIEQTNVIELIRGNPEMIYSVIKTLCNRLDDANERVRSLQRLQ